MRLAVLHELFEKPTAWHFEVDLGDELSGVCGVRLPKNYGSGRGLPKCMECVEIVNALDLIPMFRAAQAGTINRDEANQRMIELVQKHYETLWPR